MLICSHRYVGREITRKSGLTTRLFHGSVEKTGGQRLYFIAEL